MLSRRTFLGSIALTALADPAAAADWPQKSVRIIYPYAAGSAGDAAARLIAQRLSEVFGQAFIVENRVGGNGTLAAESVARAPADGYTLFWATTPQIAIAPAMAKVAYDPVKDFAPISLVLTNTFVLVVNPQMPVKTVAEFVDYVRARPNKLVYASSFGSVSHLTMALFLNRAGLEMSNVSYRGNAPALNDVIAGHVPTMFALLGDARAHAMSGSVRLLAVSSERRSMQAPEIPTISESGFPQFNAVAWNGLLAPARTPKPIVDRIAAEVARAVRDNTFAGRLSGLGTEPLGHGPAEFATMIATDILQWDEALRISGLGLP